MKKTYKKIYQVEFPALNWKKKAEEGTLLLDVIRESGYEVETPCGGNGKCGKCRVSVKSMSTQNIHAAEADQKKEKEEKVERTEIVPSCTYRIHKDIRVEFLKDEITSVQILTDFAKDAKDAENTEGNQYYDPVCFQLEILLQPNKIGEYENDTDRLRREIARQLKCPMEEIIVSMEAVREMAQILRSAAYHIYVILCDHVVIHVDQMPMSCYMAAFDIGTTTIAGYLVNSATGKVEGIASGRNPQKEFGADVVSRATYAMEGGLEVLAGKVQETVSQMLEEMALQAGIVQNDIYFITLVGNTCMHHLFLSIMPESLLTVPYNAAVSGMIKTSAEELQIKAGKGAQVCLLPVIAGFVGADTVGCLSAIDFYHESNITLMIDIGTNGELVLGTGEKAMCCSTAAGPALEGASIRFGMCAGKGAISHASVQGNELILEVIGDEGTTVKIESDSKNMESTGKTGNGAENGVTTAATGICGSGIIDLVAVLTQQGLIDKRGRICTPEKAKTEFARHNSWRLVQKEEGKCIQLTDQVYLTQKDIREVQLAKSAIRSGIEILRQKMGLSYEEITSVKLAGAFGNFMRVESACAIGLIPMELKERIKSIGNAAGAGALRAARQQTALRESQQIVKKVVFQELASESEFQKIYVQNLNF